MIYISVYAIALRLTCLESYCLFTCLRPHSHKGSLSWYNFYHFNLVSNSTVLRSSDLSGCFYLRWLIITLHSYILKNLYNYYTNYKKQMWSWIIFSNFCHVWRPPNRRELLTFERPLKRRFLLLLSKIETRTAKINVMMSKIKNRTDRWFERHQIHDGMIA